MKKKVLLIGIMALAMFTGSCKGDNSEKAQGPVVTEENGNNNESKFDFEEEDRKLAEKLAEEAASQDYVEEQFTDDTEEVVEDEAENVLILQPGQSLPQPDDMPVVVDLFATWCGPCQSYGPIFDKVATIYANKAKFVRVDIDQNPEISAEFEINAIPTTVILCSGKEPVKLVGMLSQIELQDAIDQALN